ncbi:MAG: hypothetical protein QOJ93_3226 [Actinomycetota bacterium]|nr:hypothetical protein [Actinomycetota bacterium]
MGVEAPKIEADEEVRLAVVLYGGSSLCIYMNGVAQELLRLVRATAGETFDPETAVAFPTEALDGTEQVYRQLAQLGPDDPGTPRPGDPLCRRFVVDILTGSSAGGINGIFLAKALANNQSLDQLKQLWIEKGDIVQLYNDGKHSKDVNLKPERPPKSLLDGRWMYANLVTALDGMGKDPEVTSPLVRELDLFVTATDLYGLPVSVRLANGAAVERKHRQVFHFRYGAKEADQLQNDFGAANNAFLAFTARCTSSLPFVFQPMTLGTIDQLLPHVPAHAGTSNPSQNEKWADFYWDYSAEQSPDPDNYNPRKIAMDNFVDRPFGDGGSLDNSPFTFATEMLAHRHGELPVSRKLLYLEPDPVTEEGWNVPPELPDAGQNFLMQFVTLPRSQTVSEDLHALKDRNRLIRRVQDALAAAEPVFAEPQGDVQTPALLRTPEELYRQYGEVYLAYRRLKTASVVDDLATLTVLAGGLEPDSDEWGAVRALVSAWRDQEFGDDDKQSDAFLMQYDLGFRLRKVNFVERVASELDRAVTWKLAHPGSEKPDRWNVHVVRGLDRLPQAHLGDLHDDEEWLKAFQKKLREARNSLTETGNALWRARIDVSASTDLVKAITESKINRKVIQTCLLDPSRTADELYRNAGKFVEEHRSSFQEIGTAMQQYLDGFLADHKTGSSAQWRAELSNRSVDASEGGQKALQCLSFYFDNYEQYDMLVLPIIYGTDAGESALVEIFRISPVDAPSFGSWDLSPKSHVAGNRYSHFGAFLEKVWRQNDVMWGRMDAAGCIIDALMPDYEDPDRRREVRDELIKDAHKAIVGQELGETGRQMLTTMLLDELSQQQPTTGGKASSKQPGPTAADVKAAQAKAASDRARADQLLAAADVAKARAGDAAAAGSADAAKLEDAERVASAEAAKAQADASKSATAARDKAVGAAVAAVLKRVDDAKTGTKLQQLLTAALGEADLLDYVTRTQQTEWKLPPADELVIATRGTHVLGEVLKGMSTSKGALARPGAWISLVGRMGSGVAEVALNRSIGHLLRWHWLALVVTFVGLTIVGGLTTSTPAVTQFGLMALLGTVLAAGAVWSMSQVSKSRRRWVIFPVAALVVVVGGLMALGVVELVHLGKQHSWIPVFGQSTPGRSPSPSSTPSP